MKREIIGRGTIVVLIVVIVAVIVGGTVGYVLKSGEKGTTTDNQKPSFTVYFVGLGDPADVTWHAHYQGALDIAQLLNIDLHWVWGKGDTETMANAIQEAIAVHADGLVVSPTSVEPFKTLFEQAMAAGIPIVQYEVGYPEIKSDCFVGVASIEEFGVKQISEVNDLIKDGSDVLILAEDPGAAYAAGKITGIQQWIENLAPDAPKNVNLKVLNCTWDIPTQVDRISAELSANPEKYVAIVALGSVVTKGAYLAEKQLNINPGKLPISGIGLGDETFAGIREGYIRGVTTWQPWLEGFSVLFQLYPMMQWGFEPMPDYKTSMGWVDSSNVDFAEEQFKVDRW